MWGENTTLAATASRAAAYSRPRFIRPRMRSRMRKAAWPSLTCQTGGLEAQGFQGADAADAEEDFLFDAGVLSPP